MKLRAERREKWLQRQRENQHGALKPGGRCVRRGWFSAITCVPGTFRGQKKALDPLELKWVVVSYHTDAEN